MSSPTSFVAKLPAAARDRIRSGLQLLLDAWTLAADANSTAADFAVELDSLQHIGLSAAEIRWLIRKGYAQHLLDISLPGEANRVTRVTPSLNFCNSSCIVLTPEGAAFATSISDGHRRNAAPRKHSKLQKVSPGTIPVWNSTLRELQVGGRVLKKLRVDAKYQENILSAFEEEGWPVHIADPIHPTAGIVPRDRLSKAVYDLNRGIRAAAIVFRCVDGKNIVWEAAAPTRFRKTAGGNGPARRRRRS